MSDIISGNKIKITWGKYKDKMGTVARWSALGNLYIVLVENISIPGQYIEIALRENEMEIILDTYL